MSIQKQTKSILFSILLGIVSFALMTLFFSLQQSLMVASIVIMVTLWTNEALPLAVVSLLPIVVFPALGILSTKETAMHYANPIIFLFLGGFLIAIAVEKTNLHQYIAQKMLHIFPRTPRGILFALVLTSGLLSSVLSNTTTTLLLLPIALFLTQDIKFKMRLALGIAYGASVGGILTPIGTPPNLILMGIMEKFSMDPIPFVQWIYMVAPLVFVMFLAVGFILSIGLKDITIEIPPKLEALNKEQKKVLFLISALIFTLFINAPLKPFYNGLGLSEPGILLTAGLLLFAPPFSILNWEQDSHRIPYKIMFLFGAGFAIAAAFTHTGMAGEIASYLVHFATMPLIIFLLILATIVTFTTEITSNTALISIMLPILFKVAEQTQVDATLIMMVATICASYAFMLPIATPPNAIAMSSGVISIKQMATYGILFNILGIVLIVSIANLFWIHLI